MPYPDTTRTVYYGIEAVERTPAATKHFLHTMNEPAHTLQNGIIIPEENTGTRTRDNGQSRGKRGSSLRLQSYVRIDELGLWAESFIGAGSTINFPNYTSQLVTLTGTPAGGTFTLSYGGQVTTAIAFGAAAAAVEAALEALSNLAPADVTVAGSAGGPWTVTFPLLVPGLPGSYGPFQLIGDGSLLTGGTSPAVVITAPTSVSGAYLRTYRGGLVRGLPITVDFFNGLYWREMSGARVNTANIQGFGNQLAMIDFEIVGPASIPISPPTVIAETRDYVPVDVPMQICRFANLINADVDRMGLTINNNLTQRSTMDGTTSTRRTRFGFYSAEFDGMVDYPAYAGSLYEAMETNISPGPMDIIMVDDLHTAGTVTPIHPYADIRTPSPLLADTTEGSDGGELVQMVKGRGQYSLTEVGTTVLSIATDKPGSFFAAS